MTQTKPSRRAFLVLALTLASACESPRGLDWTIVYESPALEAEAHWAEWRIRPGGCAGGVSAHGVLESAATLDVADALPPGTYGFEAVATDGRCRVIGQGCVTQTLPLAPGATITTTIVRVSMPCAICEAEPRCTPADRGDAGPPEGDAGELDAPRIVAPWRGLATGHPVAGALDWHWAFEWTAIAGASQYEIQLASGCATPSDEACLETRGFTLTSTTTTRFPSLTELTATDAFGTRFSWRARACAAGGCGPYSEIGYVDVGHVRGDRDGDGFGDLAIGAAASSTVEIHHGSGDGTVTRSLLVPPPAGIADSHCGWSMSFCDLDGDLRDELVVGCPGGSRTGPGAVYVGDTQIGLGSGTRAMGEAIACGDLDGDGGADIVAGAPGHVDDDMTSLDGAVMVFMSDGRTIRLPMPSGITIGNVFGHTAAVADFDGDARLDLAIGTGNGARVFVYLGGPEGPTPMHDAVVGPFDDAFGASIGAADLGDGASLIAGVGTIRSFRWDGASFVEGSVVAIAPATAGLFGYAIAATADGRRSVGDVALGAYANGDSVTWLRAGVAGSIARPAEIPVDPDPQFGSHVEIADLRGDGAPEEIIVSAPMTAPGGTVYVLSPALEVIQTLESPGLVRYGRSLAAGGI